MSAMTKPATTNNTVELSHDVISAYVETAHRLRSQECGRLIGLLFALPRKLLDRLAAAKSAHRASGGQHAAS